MRRYSSTSGERGYAAAHRSRSEGTLSRDRQRSLQRFPANESIDLLSDLSHGLQPPGLDVDAMTLQHAFLRDHNGPVHDLVSKVASLESDKRKAIEDLHAAEQHYKLLVRNVRAKLASEDNSKGKLQATLAQITDKLSGLPLERQRLEDMIAQEATNAQAEVRRLSQLRNSREVEVEAAQADVIDLRRQLECMYMEKTSLVEDSFQLSRLGSSLSNEIEDARTQLHDIEHRRMALRDGYHTRGERIQHAINLSAKDCQTTVDHLKERVNQHRRKYDKGKKVFDRLGKDISTEEAAMRAQEILIDDKILELARLQRQVADELDKPSQWEARCSSLFESREDGRSDSHEIVAWTMHQKLLEEQAVYFHERMRELEQQVELETEVFASVLSRQALRFEENPWEDEDTCLATDEPSIDAGFLADFAAGFDATRTAEISAEASSVKLQKLREARSRAEQRILDSETAGQANSKSLHKADHEISELVVLADDERKTAELATVDTDMFRTEASAALEKLAALKTDVRQRKDDAMVVESLRSAVHSFEQKVVALTDVEKGHRQAHDEYELELSSLATEVACITSEATSFELQTARLEHQAVVERNSLKDISVMLCHASELVKMHIADARLHTKRLRADAASEFQDLMMCCQDQTHRFEIIMHQNQTRTRSEVGALKQLCEERENCLGRIEREVQTAINDNQYLEQTLEQTEHDECNKLDLRKELQSEFESQMHTITRLLDVTSALIPSVVRSEETKPRSYHSNEFHGSTLPEILANLQEGLGAAHATVRSNLGGTEEQQSEANEGANCLKHVEAAEMLSSAENERGALESTLKSRQAELESRKETCSARQLEVENEMRSRESKLNSLHETIRIEESESFQLAHQVQRLQLHSSLSFDLSRSDVVEHFKRQFYGLLSEVDELREVFCNELQELDSKSEGQVNNMIRVHEQQCEDLRATLIEESDIARREISGATLVGDEGLHAASQEISELEQQLAWYQAALVDRRSANQLLQDECESSLQEEARSRSVERGAEAKCVQAKHTRRLGQQELEERRAELMSTQRRQMIDLRRAKDTEVVSLKARLSNCFNGISAVSHDEDEPSSLKLSSFSLLDNSALL